MSNIVPEGGDHLSDFLDEGARKETHNKMKAHLERQAARINKTLEEVDGYTNVPYGKEFIERWGKGFLKRTAEKGTKLYNDMDSAIEKAEMERERLESE